MRNRGLGKKYFSRGVEKKFKEREKKKRGTPTILTNHNPYALSSVANMNREKNQNRMGVADLSPQATPGF